MCVYVSIYVCVRMYVYVCVICVHDVSVCMIGAVIGVVDEELKRRSI